MAGPAACCEEAWSPAQGSSSSSRSLLKLGIQDCEAGTLPRRKPRPSGQALPSPLDACKFLRWGRTAWGPVACCFFELHHLKWEVGQTLLGRVKLRKLFFSLPPFSEDNSRFLFQGLWANLVDSLLSWLEPLNQSRPLILSFHPACWDRLEWPWKAIIWTDVSVSRWLPSTGPSQFLMPELQGEDVWALQESVRCGCCKLGSACG